jgi:hypothetical protein
MTTGRVIVQARPARTATIAPQEVGRNPTLVNEHVLRGVVHRLGVAPVPPLGRDVSAPLFVRVYGFF